MKWHAAAWLAGVGGAIALGAAGTVARTNEPLHAEQQADCSCHESSVFEDHTPAFIELDHGPAALRDRRLCTGCHTDEAAECQQCHEEAPPEWHSEPMRAPESGPAARRAHIQTAAERTDTCAECHRSRFQATCAHCHRPTETWIGEGR